MPNGDNQQPQFDGQNPVSGYTLFHGKDGVSYYLKGENLSDADVSQRVSAIRGQQSPAQQTGAYQTRKGGPVFNPLAAGQAPNQISADNPIMPLPGETSGETMRRAADVGRQITPGQIAAEHRQNIRRAPIVAAAAPVIGAAGAAGIAGGGEAAGALFGPTVTSETVGTGIVDSLGNEITREVVRYGPSFARQALTWAAQNKGNIALLGVAYQIARASGIPLPDVLGKLIGGGKAAFRYIAP